MEILFFGIAKDIVGKSQIGISEVSKGLACVGDLKKYLIHEFPELSNLSSFAVAVNSEYAKDHVPLKRNDEIAIIPPVSGG